MARVEEDWAGKFVLINTADDTPLAVYPSREHRSFPSSMKVPGKNGGIVSPFKSATLAQMAAMDIYPLIDDLPAHDPGWQEPQKAGLKNNSSHYVQLYTLRERSPREVADSKRQLINAERERLEADGFIFAGIPYDSNEKSVTRITGAALFGLVIDKLNEPTIAAALTGMGITPPVAGNVAWTAGDNSIQSLSPVHVLLFALTAAQYVEGVFVASQTHKSAIETLVSGGATAQEIWAYDHMTGWPASAGLAGAEG